MNDRFAHLLAAAVFACLLLNGCRQSQNEPRLNDHPRSDSAKQAGGDGMEFTTVVNRPTGPPRVDSGQVDSQGNPIMVACSTCHTTRQPDFSNQTSADLDEFHVGIPFAHGNTTCMSCHHPEDYDALKLSDGRRIEYPDVMTMCSQCHASQARDYENGAHGGMTGYWDLKRGSRARNNCVDCHDPHVPKFPPMVPTFKPIDRFLNAH